MMDLIDTTFTLEQTLLTASDDYQKFTATLALVFDVDCELVANLANYDYLSRPKMEPNVNYAQWLTGTPDERNPIAELLSYLFTKTDDVWDEPFLFTERELVLRKLHLNKIKTYGNATHYFRACSEKLLKEEDYLEKQYFYYIKLIDRII